MRRMSGRVKLSKHCHPTSERKHLPFKGEFRAQLDYVTRCMFTTTTGLDSVSVQCHFSEALCLGWQVYCSGVQREIRGRELLGLIEEQRKSISITGFSSN
jgi:hypothetical protein